MDIVCGNGTVLLLTCFILLYMIMVQRFERGEEGLVQRQLPAFWYARTAAITA